MKNKRKLLHTVAFCLPLAACGGGDPGTAPTANATPATAQALSADAAGDRDGTAQGRGRSRRQPAIGVRSKAALQIGRLKFRDANGNGQLDPYEDWRLPTTARTDDLVARMTLEQKAGLMLIETLNAGCGGATTGTSTSAFVQAQKKRRFILRYVVRSVGNPCDGSVVPGRAGFVVTPLAMASLRNAVQELAEAEPLGIPVQFKDNARNHDETAPRFGSFTTMAASQSWRISPSLADIQSGMNEVGAEKTVLAIYFRNPYVLDEASGLRSAGAILASFGVSDNALLEVTSGHFKPMGRLPFALADNLQAVIDNAPDAPGHPPADTLYPFGFGLRYQGDSA